MEVESRDRQNVWHVTKRAPKWQLSESNVKVLILKRDLRWHAAVAKSLLDLVWFGETEDLWHHREHNQASYVKKKKNYLWNLESTLVPPIPPTNNWIGKIQFTKSQETKGKLAQQWLGDTVRKTVEMSSITYQLSKNTARKTLQRRK